jgi:hypothetical protein
MGLGRVVFSAYNSAQLETILAHRLKGLPAFDAAAIAMTSKKIAAISVNRGIGFRVNPKPDLNRPTRRQIDSDVVNPPRRIHVGKQCRHPERNCWPRDPNQLPEGKWINH